MFNLCYSDETGVPKIVFTNIECTFRKCGIYSYLIFCETDKNKNMINNYVKFINQLKEELLSWIDELEEDEIFDLGKNFMRFKIRTDDNLVYNQNINIPVCVISLSSVVKNGNIYYPNFRLQKCFYECESFYKIGKTRMQTIPLSYIRSSSSCNFDFVYRLKTMLCDELKYLRFYRFMTAILKDQRLKN